MNSAVALFFRGAQYVIVFLMVFCVSVQIYFAKRWEEETWYFQGFKEAKGSQLADSIKSLERAVHWFGGDVNNNYELGNSYGRYAKELADKGLKEEAMRTGLKA